MAIRDKDGCFLDFFSLSILLTMIGNLKSDFNVKMSTLGARELVQRS